MANPWQPKIIAPPAPARGVPAVPRDAVVAIADGMSAAMLAKFGTPNLYDLTADKRTAMIDAQRAWLTANGNVIFPGWKNGSAANPADGTLLGWLQYRAMNADEFTANYIAALWDALPDFREQLFRRRIVGRVVGEITNAYRPGELTPDIRWARYNLKNSAEWMTASYAEMIFPESRAWANPTALALGFSYLDQYGDVLQVAPPPTYNVAESFQHNLSRNLQNLGMYAKALTAQARKLENGQTVVPVSPTYASGYHDESFMAHNLGRLILLTEIIALAYIAAPFVGTNPVGNFITDPWGSIKSAVTKPLSVVKSAITDPVGAAQDYAHEQLKAEVIKVTGPLGRVYDIVVDPAGFVKDKFTEEVLYPLQHPGDWIVDQGKKQIQNRLTGEVRDLLTGLLVSPAGAVPVTITADTVPLSAVVETTPGTAKKSGGVMGPLLLVLAAVELFS